MDPPWDLRIDDKLERIELETSTKHICLLKSILNIRYLGLYEMPLLEILTTNREDIISAILHGPIREEASLFV